MQRRTTSLARTDAATTPDDRCPACGREIEGIEATAGEHRFVGCGHSASSRPLPSASGPAFAGVTTEKRQMF
ncbi:MAG: hypothetical protein ABEH88_09025 [Halobacteriales archaeon]